MISRENRLRPEVFHLLRGHGASDLPMRRRYRTMRWMLGLAITHWAATTPAESAKSSSRIILIAEESQRAFTLLEATSITSLTKGLPLTLTYTEWGVFYLAEARRVLRELPHLYVANRLGKCAALASRAQQKLAEHHGERLTKEVPILKRLNQWVGLCRMREGGYGSARIAFRLSSRLKGPHPDPDIFPPKAMAFYEKSIRRASPTCKARLGDYDHSEVLIDGTPVRTGMFIPTGVHYISWIDHEATRRGGRIIVKRRCRIGDKIAAIEERVRAKSILKASRPRERMLQKSVFLARARLRDRKFLASMGQIASVHRILTVSTDTRRIRLSLFDVKAQAFIHETQAIWLPARSHSETLRQGVRRLLVPIKTAPTHVNVQRDASQATPTRWYHKPWIWAIAAGTTAVIVTGVGIGIAVASSPQNNERFDIKF